jgi:hypothetical protein
VASPLTASRCKEREGGKKRRRKVARRSWTAAAARDTGEGDTVVFFFVGKRHCTAARLHYLKSPLHHYPSAMSLR